MPEHWRLGAAYCYQSYCPMFAAGLACACPPLLCTPPLRRCTHAASHQPLRPALQAFYYILDGAVYQAPSLQAALLARMVGAQGGARTCRETRADASLRRAAAERC